MAQPEAARKGEDRKLRDVWGVRSMNTRSDICGPKFRLRNIDVLSEVDI
jgi:hypothetical protein